MLKFTKTVAVIILALFAKYSYAQSELEISTLRTISKNFKLPQKISEHRTIVDVKFQDTDLIYTILMSDKLAGAFEKLTERETLNALEAESKDLCPRTISMRKRLKWLDIKYIYINKSNKILLNFSTKKLCKQFNENTKNADVLPIELLKTTEEKLQQIKKELKFPIKMTEQFWMMDIYFDQKDAVIYKYKFNDVSRSKLGRSLSAFVTSYTKTACADKNRQQSKRIWAPQHFSEELIGSDGQQIAMIAISKVCN